MRTLTLLLLSFATLGITGCGDDAIARDMTAPDLSTPDLTPPIDLARPDFAGVSCGAQTCGSGQDCCAMVSGTSLTEMCMPTGSCADGGAALMCDGPEDCSTGAGECCVTLQFSFSTTDGGPPPSGAGDSKCVNKCVASAVIGSNMGTLHTRLCHLPDDCANLSGMVSFGGGSTTSPFTSCCTRMGANGLQFCAPPPSGFTMNAYTCQ